MFDVRIILGHVASSNVTSEVNNDLNINLKWGW